MSDARDIYIDIMSLDGEQKGVNLREVMVKIREKLFQIKETACTKLQKVSFYCFASYCAKEWIQAFTEHSQPLVPLS